MTNKKLIGAIVGVLLFGIAIAGATYAYFRTSLEAVNNVSSNSSLMNIVYTGGGTFSGSLNLGTTRNDGYVTNVNIHTDSESVKPAISVFLNINEISQDIAVEGFIWEICAERTGDEITCRSGNFSGYNDTNNNKVYLYSNYQLSNVNTKFTVYLWLNGSLVGDTVLDARFSGYIAAESEHFTAKFS